MMTDEEAWHARHREIVAALQEPGATYENVGERYSISRQRVHQIAKKYGITKRGRSAAATRTGKIA